MNTTQANTDSLSIDVLRQLAFMQHEGTDFFIEDGKAYEGNKKELWDEWVKCTENLPNAQTWDEFREDNCPEVCDFDNDDYLVLTDEEADEKAKEYITESLWAFNPSFLASMTDFDEEVFQAIADNGKCESNNDVIYNTIQKTCGISDFVEAAISADGRGHFMSSYDGEENEETVNIPSGGFYGLSSSFTLFWSFDTLLQIFVPFYLDKRLRGRYIWGIILFTYLYFKMYFLWQLRISFSAICRLIKHILYWKHFIAVLRTAGLVVKIADGLYLI